MMMIMVVIVLVILVGGGGFLGRQRFAAQLKKEIPKWIEKGWVEQSGGDKILASVAGGRKHAISTAFAILGVILFGSGVITFMASNWNEIPKLIKLVILFSSMWAAFTGALWCHLREAYMWLSEAMLLLGVILFGVNIMLIAQIYHIDSHYPNGVLVWGLGALFVAWLMESKPVFIVSILLTLLWTAMESFGFLMFHWQFLLVWGIQLFVSIRCDWRGMIRFLALSFLIWSAFSFFTIIELSSTLNMVYLVQDYFIFYLILFLLGMHLRLNPVTVSYGEMMQKSVAIAALACSYILTFPDFLEGKIRVSGSYSSLRPPADNLWLWIMGGLLLVLISLALWHRKRTLQQNTRQAYHVWGLGVLGAMLLVMLVNMTQWGEAALIAVMFNIVYFIMLIWLMFFGMRTENRPLVNMAFLFFAITLLSRYFDTFWKLLDRSLFFMVGGVLLIALGIILEKKRRKLVAGIDHKQGVPS
ncbi:MAG: DUF2157 domain-containing protein [Mariprofundaceae bacterium]|nr:DUF2157 domain-containing protein [Mariprofundaceae bacterium]